MDKFTQTINKARINLINPDRAVINIYDIAESLAKQCRFLGQCEGFYSVARHSVILSKIVPTELALRALLHDAHEAYMGDITSPIKALIREETDILERLAKRLDSAIFSRFNVTTIDYDTVHDYDRRLLAYEYIELMGDFETTDLFRQGVRPLPYPIQSSNWTSTWSIDRRLFLMRFQELTNGKC